VRIQGRELRRVRTYAEGRPGEPVALEGSSGLLEVAAGGGSAAAELDLAPGTTAILTTATLTPPAEP
jgi:S-adenosylmethionine hydrolase